MRHWGAITYYTNICFFFNIPKRFTHRPLHRPRRRPRPLAVQVLGLACQRWFYSVSCTQSFPAIKRVRSNSPSGFHRLTLSYRALSFSAIASYFDLTSGSTSDHLLPNSLAISPTPNSGFFSLTLLRSSLQNQKKADLENDKNQHRRHGTRSECPNLEWSDGSRSVDVFRFVVDVARLLKPDAVRTRVDQIVLAGSQLTMISSEHSDL